MHTLPARFYLGVSQVRDRRLGSQPVDELFWELHDLVVAERDVLESLVRELSMRGSGDSLPRYRNPENQTETWTGRGRRPRWLTAKLRAGGILSDFVIQRGYASAELAKD
jgi:hypothetical protein